MNYFSFESRWISDGIGEEYKTWKPKPKNNSFTSSPRIFIESPTGTGKTSFIINKLLPYAATEGKHILYLGNRTALEKQTQNAAEKNLIPIRNFEIFTFSRKPDVANIYKYPNSSSTITILNYQAVLGFLKSPLYKSSLEPFDYIVLDEAHFFLEDAIFNAMTGAIFDRLMSEFSTKVIIFMSATIGEFIDIFDITRKKRIPYHPYQNIFNNFYSEDIRYYFNLYRETHYYPFIFQKDDEILRKISKTPDQEKWLIFVSSKKQGESLEKNIKAKTHKSVIFLNASKKKTDDWNRIIDNSFYEEDIFISTKVLDNGVNIIDPSIKHIVLPFCYRIDFLQMLGRLRCSENGRINVYIKQPTIQTLNIHTLQLLKLNDAILDFEEFTKSNKAMTQQLQRLWAISDRRVNNLFYVDNNRNLIVNTMAYLKINLLIFFYSGLLNNYKNSNYYLNIVKSWLGQSSKSVFAPIGLPNCTSLEDFIKLYLNKPISKEDIEDLYNGFQQLYKIHCAELFVSDSNKLNEALGIRKGRDRRISTMNNELKFLDFPYKITKKQGCLALRRFAE